MHILVLTGLNTGNKITAVAENIAWVGPGDENRTIICFVGSNRIMVEESVEYVTELLRTVFARP